MALSQGTRLGPYEIVSPLGAGGMGEVYKARDTRLERTVAIKILGAHLTGSPELKQRFDREARAISSLNHPHICHLYDVGAQDGTDYLVMEFLEGESLADRLRKGPVPTPELLKIGAEVAEALEVAHRAGIVHRDLKPGNVMLTKSGAKLMDFGLAKPSAVGAAASGTAPLLSAARTGSGGLSPMSPLTTAGAIVGTVQYMSPEQIEGKDADPRSDVFALGAVLYEMATGKRAFDGKSQISVASAILEKEPEPISVVQPMSPPALEHVVVRALAKDPDARWQSAADIGGELKWIAANPSSSRLILPGVSLHRKGRERLAWATAAIAILALIALAALSSSRESGVTEPIRGQIAGPPNTSFVFIGDNGGPPVLSPDGKMLAFVAAGANGIQQIYVRPLDSLDARVLVGSDNAWAPFWSPDGRKLGFFADGKLKIVDAQGGTPVAVTDAANGRGGSWCADGAVLFSPDYRSAIYRVPASGGTATPVTKLDENVLTSHRWPYCLPDSKHFLYLGVNHDAPRSDKDGIYFASLDGKENVRLVTAYTEPQYAAGHLLYVRDGQLVAQSLSTSNGKLKDDEQTVAQSVAEDGSTWRAIYTVSANGVLVYSAGDINRGIQLAWFDRTGKQLSSTGEKLAVSYIARLSPKGDRIALNTDSGGTTDVWVLDVGRGVRTRITFGPTGNVNPVWSPDGKWIAYQDVAKHSFILARRPADGGPEEALLQESVPVLPSDWSRDGKYLMYWKGAIGTHTEVWALPLFGDRKPFQVIPPGPYQSNLATFSPDGKWVAYGSDESGRFEVYVVPFGKTGGKWQVSTAGGSIPIWRRDGKEIFYVALDATITAVPVAEQGDQLKLGPPQPLFQSTVAAFAGFDVSPDGKKFLTGVSGEKSAQPLTLVVNWQADLKH
jgi:eukaryotic-like serine/threonine-protein kinase